mmetsp:Transcript_65078/g.105222  ORF Transcript_65078/g.105222 Transcript_65078/m.105222 type:complete len:214 (+) Transcript_65078:225-866(+)
MSRACMRDFPRIMGYTSSMVRSLDAAPANDASIKDIWSTPSPDVGSPLLSDSMTNLRRSITVNMSAGFKHSSKPTGSPRQKAAGPPSRHRALAAAAAEIGRRAVVTRVATASKGSVKAMLTQQPSVRSSSASMAFAESPRLPYLVISDSPKNTLAKSVQTARTMTGRMPVKRPCGPSSLSTEAKPSSRPVYAKPLPSVLLIEVCNRVLTSSIG